MGTQLRVSDDVTSLFPGDGEMARRCRAVDWARTPLGPTELWPAALRTAVRTAIGSPFPILLWCGPELTLVYNDGYSAILGSKHPAALGRSGRDVWGEIWPDIEPMFDWSDEARTTYAENQRFEMNRADGTLGDAWFTFARQPDPRGGRPASSRSSIPRPETTRAGRGGAQARARARRRPSGRSIASARCSRRHPRSLPCCAVPSIAFEFANDAYDAARRLRAPLVGRTRGRSAARGRGAGFRGAAGSGVHARASRSSVAPSP